MNMKWIATLVLGAAAVTAAVGNAHAGLKVTYPLSISKNPDGSGYAMGTLADIRNSSDSTQVFTCRIVAYSTGSPSVTCWGTDASSQTFMCSSSSAAVVGVAESLTADSLADVAWDSSGNCTTFYVFKSSFTTPKTS